MSDSNQPSQQPEREQDRAPGYERQPGDTVAAVRGYLVGLGLAALLTLASFWAGSTHLIYGPGVPMALLVFAVAQMGIHLVFFLHLTTSPDNTNNTLALAFGVLIVTLVVFGSVWIMAHLNHRLIPMDELMRMQR